MYNNTITGQTPAKHQATRLNSGSHRQALVDRLRRNVPPEIRLRKWWVLNGQDKRPVRPNGNGLSGWQKPENHRTMDDALATLMKAPPAVAGVGVILPCVERGNPLPAPPISCIDLDHCLNEDGTPKDTPGLREILKRFGHHYMERSRSSDGLHIWYSGTWPPGVTPKLLYKGVEVEVYERNHHIIPTGDIWTPPGGTPNTELAEAGHEVGWLNAEFKTHGKPVPKKNAAEAAKRTNPTGSTNEAERSTVSSASGTASTADSVIEAARRCLAHLPGWWRDDYDSWIRAGMAVHDATGGSAEGLALWDDWSRGSDKYKDGETARKWAGFTAGGGVSIKTLRYHSGLYPDMERPEEDFAEYADPDWSRDKANAEENVCPMPPGFSLAWAGEHAGLWHTEAKDDGDPIRTWIGPPLEVLGVTRDSESKAWGLLLAWHDQDGIRHTWAMPKALLEGDPTEYRKRLADEGWNCAPNKRAREKLALFLATVRPKARALCVPRTGWHDGAYVLPDEILYGETAPKEQIVLQTQTVHNPFLQKEPLEKWQDGVGALALGNNRLMLALCAAFAAPLLHVGGVESGGFNFIGGSSTGKTTALLAAASVWGKGTRDGGYMTTWRATSNGLEGLAALHSDALLAIDELGQASARTVSEAAYMLANGTGKNRARQDGTAKAAQNWRVMMVSTGEVGLAQRIAEEGGTAKAGQQIRLLDIPADAGRGMGIFEDLHGYTEPSAFAAALQEKAASAYGTAARAFIHKMQEHGLDAVARQWREYRDGKLEELAGEGADGQTKRAAERFLLCILAGTLAADWGILPWPRDAVARAVWACFNSWLEHRGGNGAAEDRAVIEAVKLFLQLHGQSRFQRWNENDICPNRVGFRRTDGADFDETGAGKTTYYIFKEAFEREIVKDHDLKRVKRVLRDAGILKMQGKDMTRSERLPGMGTTRVYCLALPDTEERAGNSGAGLS